MIAVIPGPRPPGAYRLQLADAEALHMTLNLVQHRGEPSIWDRDDMRREWDTERWFAAVVAGAFLVSGFRRRDPIGFAMAVGGGALAWWAAKGVDERRVQRARMLAALPSRAGEGDAVHEA